MPTIQDNKTNEILTESEKVFEELRQELSVLQKRVDNLEVEQDENRELIHDLGHGRELANELLSSQAEEREENRENYQIIAQVMNGLKNPVNEVVDNLSEMVNEIPDQEIQDSLRDCVSTAASVLDSFNQVEAFCHQLGDQDESKVSKVEFRKNLKSILKDLKAPSGRLRMLVDKQVPSYVLVDEALMAESIKAVMRFLLENSPDDTQVTVQGIKHSEGRIYGVQMHRLLLRMESSEPGDLKWNGDWSQLLEITAKNYRLEPLHWVALRDRLRKNGGDMQLFEKEGKLSGVEICFPITN